LQQETQIPFEIVVVDNSEQINMKFVEWLKEKEYTKVCYYKNSQNLGMFGNWNRCITLSQGEWVLILNDDDEILFIDENNSHLLNDFSYRTRGCPLCSFA
jgi:GT2 family glycosyltransferase